MHLFSSKPKVPKGPFYGEQDQGSTRPRISSPLRRTVSSTQLPELAYQPDDAPVDYRPSHQRYGSRARAEALPPVPTVPSQYTSPQSSYHRSPLQGAQDAVMPNTVTRQLTPPGPTSDEEAQEAPEPQEQQAPATPSTDTWVDPQFWSPHATAHRAQMGRDAAQSASSTNLSSQQFAAAAQAARPQAPASRAASGSTARVFPATTSRPHYVRSPSQFQPPPVQMSNMRVHIEPHPGNQTNFLVELRFDLTVNLPAAQNQNQ